MKKRSPVAKIPDPNKAPDPKAASLILFWFGAAFIVVPFLFGGLLGKQAWVEAQLRAHGRTVPAQILGIDRDFGGGDGGEILSVHYQFPLPSGAVVDDILHASPKEVEANLGVGTPQFGMRFGTPALPSPAATVRYLPDRPEEHRLLEFGVDDTSGSPLAGGPDPARVPRLRRRIPRGGRESSSASRRAPGGPVGGGWWGPARPRAGPNGGRRKFGPYSGLHVSPG